MTGQQHAMDATKRSTIAHLIYQDPERFRFVEMPVECWDDVGELISDQLEDELFPMGGTIRIEIARNPKVS